MDNHKTSRPALEKVIDLLRIALIGAAIIVLMWLAANQVQEFIHGAQLLTYPCDLCVELNPHLEHCLKGSYDPTHYKIGDNIVDSTYNMSNLNLSQYITKE